MSTQKDMFWVDIALCVCGGGVPFNLLQIGKRMVKLRREYKWKLESLIKDVKDKMDCYLL